MNSVEIDGVTYATLGTKKKVSTTAEQVLFKKGDRMSLSADDRQSLFKNATAKAHKLYDIMPLSLDDEDKFDDTYNLEVLVQKTKLEHFKYDMHDVFTIVIPDANDQIIGTKNLYDDYANVSIEQVAKSNLWYREWMVESFFEENLQLTYDFF